MSRHVSRRVAATALGLWLLAAVAAPVAVPSIGATVAAAAPDLTVVSTARYDVQPSKRRIHVTVDLTAKNHRTDTVIRSYFFERVVLGFLPEASGFTVSPATGSSAHPTVSVTSRTSARVLVSVAFGSKLRSGRTLALRLTFDLLDKGGAVDRPVRVGGAIATFPVWAVGTPETPGSRVSVTVPSDFRIEVLGSKLAGPSKGPTGTKAYASVALSAPAVFGAYVLADRPGAYRATPINVTAGGGKYSLVVRSWQDDAAFGSRTAALLRKALPALGRLIGVPPGAQGADGAPLSVEEAVTRSAGGYAALFDGGTARIQIAYDAAPAVVLHEAAHAWFNGGFVADRWMAEGFASYYASRAASPLKIKVAALPLTKALLEKRIPLNAWASEGTPDPVVDAYGMAASLNLAKLIADRIGPDGLTTVWKAIRAGEMADQPGGSGATPATAATDPAGAGVPDWRTLLDLIETRTGEDLTELWRTWVVRPEDAPLLDRRKTVRAAYRTLVQEADDWALPQTIRVALDHWQFDQAEEQIARTRTVLGARPALQTAADGIGVQLPPTLRTVFEGAGGPAAAATELAAERAAIDRLAAAIATRPADPTLLERIGLLGADPEAGITAARAAFVAGDLNGAVLAAERAATVWVGAVDVGRGRLAVAAAILATFAGLVLLVTATRDRRSRSRWSYRAGQVIRSMGPGSGTQPRPALAPVRESGPREVGPRSGAVVMSPGVQVSNRHAMHISPARIPMAHRLPATPDGLAGPRTTAWPRYGAVPSAPPDGSPASPGPRNVVAPRSGYGTLAADLPAEREAVGRRPDAGSRPRDVPPVAEPGDE